MRRKLIIAVALAATLSLLAWRLDSRGALPERLAFSTFLAKVDQDPSAFKGHTLQVRLGAANDAEISGQWTKTGFSFATTGYVGEAIVAKLTRAQIDFEIVSNKPTLWQGFVVVWLPMFFMGAAIFYLMKKAGGAAGGILNFGKSRATRAPEQRRKVGFDDVAGIDEARDEVEEIIAFLKEPAKFTRLGGRVPRGILIMGPPGTGKTLLARAIAGEAGVPFFSISGSDFVEMFVGVGASRVRDLFEQAKQNAPCIIFIDEIDAVGRQRGTGYGGGHDEREQTLNQLLVEMDGFAPNDGIILVAATNRPDVLDPALLRPGRFDRRIVVPAPDVRGRLGILKIHTRKTPLATDVALDVIARGTSGMVGADLENLVNEAALIAARGDKIALDMGDFEMAKDKVLMGPERRSMVMSAADKKVTAYHEAGHVLVGSLMTHTDPVYKATIIPRGRALGLTQQLPVDDKLSLSKESANDQIALGMGGRAAEEVVFGHFTTGAASDIEAATALARKMVCHWGMSDTIGPLSLGRPDGDVFLGRDFAQERDYSETTAILIDHEVRRIVTANYDRAKKMVLANLDKLTALANALLERDVIDAVEIDALLAGAVAVSPVIA